MTDRGDELPSRIMQSELQNPYSKSPHILFLLNEFRAALGVKSAAEAVPAELMRRILEVSGGLLAKLLRASTVLRKTSGGRMRITDD